MTAVAKTLRTPSELAVAELVGPGRLAALEKVAARYAVAITPALADLIDPSDPHDPMARQFVPDARELEFSRRKAATQSATKRIVRSKASFIAIPTASCSSSSMPVRFIAGSVSAARWSGRDGAGYPARRLRRHSTISAPHRKSGK